MSSYPDSETASTDRGRQSQLLGRDGVGQMEASSEVALRLFISTSLVSSLLCRGDKLVFLLIALRICFYAWPSMQQRVLRDMQCALVLGRTPFGCAPRT
jgi:hypothetical protein